MEWKCEKVIQKTAEYSPIYILLNERSLSRSSALSVNEWVTPALKLKIRR